MHPLSSLVRVLWSILIAEQVVQLPLTVLGPGLPSWDLSHLGCCHWRPEEARHRGWVAELLFNRLCFLWSWLLHSSEACRRLVRPELALTGPGTQAATVWGWALSEIQTLPGSPTPPPVAFCCPCAYLYVCFNPRSLQGLSARLSGVITGRPINYTSSSPRGSTSAENQLKTFQKTLNVCLCYLGTKRPFKKLMLMACFLKFQGAGPGHFKHLPGEQSPAPLAGVPTPSRLVSPGFSKVKPGAVSVMHRAVVG